MNFKGETYFSDIMNQTFLVLERFWWIRVYEYTHTHPHNHFGGHLFLKITFWVISVVIKNLIPGKGRTHIFTLECWREDKMRPCLYSAKLSTLENMQTHT